LNTNDLAHAKHHVIDRLVRVRAAVFDLISGFEQDVGDQQGGGDGL